MKYITHIPSRRQMKAGLGLVCNWAYFADFS